MDPSSYDPRFRPPAHERPPRPRRPNALRTIGGGVLLLVGLFLTMAALAITGWSFLAILATTRSLRHDLTREVLTIVVWVAATLASWAAAIGVIRVGGGLLPTGDRCAPGQAELRAARSGRAAARR